MNAEAAEHAEISWVFYPVAALSIVTLCPLAPAGASDLL